MEEKIVYRPKNRRWFFYTSARKKSSPNLGTPPCREKAQNWGFFLNWKVGFLDLIYDNPLLFKSMRIKRIDFGDNNNRHFLTWKSMLYLHWINWW